MSHKLRLTDQGRFHPTFVFRRSSGLRAAMGAILLLTTCLCSDSAHAFRVFHLSELAPGISRWNAEPHFVDGVERSLDGGLRYSVSGGSYEAFRDQFQWKVPQPTVAEFQAAVEHAFSVWEAVDPATGLGTDLRFVPDFGTPVVAQPIPDPTLLPTNLIEYFTLNPGAEIDLIAKDHGNGFVGGSAEPFGDPNASTLTLTSGVADYSGAVFSGIDIYMNSYSESPWGINAFHFILSHEIGHAIGLGDVHAYHGAWGVYTRFYDDNYDDTSSTTALATLTNSFADVIDPFDPDNSAALMLYDVCEPTIPGDPYSCFGDPGIDTPGVEIAMGQSNPPVFPQNDDFAGRQFLYPYVGLAGDNDVDGDVDGFDFLNWQLGASVNPFSAQDLADWEANYGFVPLPIPSTAVPEPTTGIILLFGMLAILFRRDVVVIKTGR
jgi:hypothetical protein